MLLLSHSLTFSTQLTHTHTHPTAYVLNSLHSIRIQLKMMEIMHKIDDMTHFLCVQVYFESLFEIECIKFNVCNTLYSCLLSQLQTLTLTLTITSAIREIFMICFFFLILGWISCSAVGWLCVHCVNNLRHFFHTVFGCYFSVFFFLSAQCHRNVCCICIEYSSCAAL